MGDDRLWRPDGDDLWTDPRADEPDLVEPPRATALADASASPTRSPAATGSSEMPADGRRSRKRIAVLAIGAALATATAATVTTSTLLRPSVEGFIDATESTSTDSALITFAGADPRRLPDSIATAWTLEIPFAADIGSSLLVRDELLVATLSSTEPCLEPPGRCDDLPDRRLEGVRTAIVAVDASTGRRMWTGQVAHESDEVDLLGVISGVLVVELRADDGRQVVGLDATDGDELWRLDRNDAESFEVLPGTSVITRSTFGSRPAQEFVDPTSGLVLERVDGAFVATDYGGRWWARSRGPAGDSLFVVDLRPRSDPSAQIVEADVDLTGIGVMTVVDGRPIAAVDGGFVIHDSASGWTPATVSAPERFRIDGGRSEGNAGSPPRVRLPDSIVGFTPTSGTDFTFTGGGSIYGASLVDGVGGPSIEVRWQLRGVITQVVPTQRGMLLVVANEGGASLRVADGVSGAILAEVQMYVGVLDSLRLVGDGFVTKRAAELGVELAAIGLDGRDRWTLVGSDPFAVGDGVVVTRTDTDDGVRLTGYRDPDG
ncbi:MAG: PQQ-binding-like beta-propeller repeat protein [Actinomycetota bacterium]